MADTNDTWPIERSGVDRVLEVRIAPIDLPGVLQIPMDARAIVAFAHGSGSSRFSPRNSLLPMP